MTTESVTDLPKLAISCTATDCDQDLHCFRSTKKLREQGLGGLCRKCHIDLIDWPRVHERQIDDVDHTFSELRHEFIRHHFWHVEIDEKAKNHALRKGRIALISSIPTRIANSVAAELPYRDGRQTPFRDNVLHYAQHATASCCRTCIEYWHNIPKGRPLTEPEQEYLGSLMARYIEDRLPDLPDGPTRVPPHRRSPGETP
jgi:hypothetical protein